MCGMILHHEGCPLGSVVELIFKTQLEGEVMSKVFSFEFFYMNGREGRVGSMQSAFLHMALVRL